MIAVGVIHSERQRWTGALIVAGGLHLMAGLTILALGRPPVPQDPDPVILLELPPLPPPADAAPALSEPLAATSVPVQPTPQPMPPIEAPTLRTPPRDAVVVPPKPVQPAPLAQAPAPLPTPAPAQQVAPTEQAPARTTSTANQSVGDDPKARKQEIDYAAMLSAYLARRKDYPAEAKKARQQGVVTIRFTVDRRGNVTGEGIKRSSGHSILDSATLQMLRRVSPLPAMPASMRKDSVTVSLPIDYSLSTK